METGKLDHVDAMHVNHLAGRYPTFRPVRLVYLNACHSTILMYVLMMSFDALPVTFQRIMEDKMKTRDSRDFHKFYPIIARA